MTDRELFDTILNRFADQYGLEISHPYDTEYFEIHRHGEYLGGMNPDGYNLLANISTLSSVLKDLLR